METTSEPSAESNSLVDVSNSGIRIVASITKYLSTLPHPIETIEELVSVISVISNLLATLNTTITRFQPVTSHNAAFVKPLCKDIRSTFSLFEQKLKEARELKVFEPNEVGFVKLPRQAWVYVMGGELRMGQFRSRLYVEKYRVRVLVDAVAWYGMRNSGSLMQRAQCEEELRVLQKMLPLIAERLMGVWRDYKPRIEGRSSKVEEVSSNQAAVETSELAPKPVAIEKVQVKEKVVEEEKKEDFYPLKEKSRLHSSPSVASFSSICSSSSSTTTISTAIKSPVNYERWILRCTEAKANITSSTNIFGLVTLSTTYNHTPSTYYVKPLLSHPSEIQLYLALQNASGQDVKNEVLKLPDDAQWEIQKLVESRENACSNENVKSNWEVVAFQSQPRRKIAPGASEGRWWKSKPAQLLEWVIVLRGETVDEKKRSMPGKHTDAWRAANLNSTCHASSSHQHHQHQMHSEATTIGGYAHPSNAFPAMSQAQGHLQQAQQIQAQNLRTAETRHVMWRQQQQQRQQYLQHHHNMAATAPPVAMPHQQQPLFNMAPHGAQVAPGAHVLRHVEQKRAISLEEAEKRMEEMGRDLFKIVGEVDIEGEEKEKEMWEKL